MMPVLMVCSTPCPDSPWFALNGERATSLPPSHERITDVEGPRWDPTDSIRSSLGHTETRLEIDQNDVYPFENHEQRQEEQTE